MDPDPAIFVSDLFKFFCLLLFEGTYLRYIIFQRKKVTKNHKTEVSMFFLLLLLEDRRIRIRISD
jgi:hypothetical protein